MSAKAPKKKARVFLPHSNLKEQLSRAGGKSRDEAVKAAMAGVETLREKSMDAIDTAIKAVEAVAQEGNNGKLSETNLKDVLRNADEIVELAGTFDLPNLDAAGRSLCDLVGLLLKTSPFPAEPIAVHARALRLFAPGRPSLSAIEIEMVLAELERFRAFFEAKPSAAP
jgi:hypothetical protein